MNKWSLLSLAVCGLVGCGGDNTESRAPAGGISGKTRALDAGADLLQERPPIEALNSYLDGFHFYNGAMHRQMEAHHYCAVVEEDFIQCVIYDGNVKNARIIGIEYIVSAASFATLPATEKVFWHSHVHEVKSGQLIAPGIPAVAEHALMEKLVSTYGKTWHMWHPGPDNALPLGVPQLMMGFTADGQIDGAMVKERDARFGVDSERKRAERADIAAPAIDADADAWSSGRVIQIADPSAQPGH